MKRNVIILTHGWTGSSVFTALLGRANYWAGEATFQKPDYNTHENVELIELNKQLMKEMGFTKDHEHYFDEAEIEKLTKSASELDLTPYKNFVQRCQNNQPWIWKDPRLTWTIRIWAKLLDLDGIAFVILTRDAEQAWISSNLRRHIQTRQFTQKYNSGITKSLEHFLSHQQSNFLSYEFENLLLNPEETLSELNEFLDISLSMEDLRSVYNGPLYQKTRNWKDKLKATAIYLKNYRERYR